MAELNTITKPRKDYVNNADFCAALVEYKAKVAEAIATNGERPPIPNYIGECFLKIAEGLSHKYNFINYTFRDEMVSDGIENCLMYFENFDPAKSVNAFAYFTQIIYYAFLRRIQKEKKQMYIKYKLSAQMSVLDERELVDFDDLPIPQTEIYDNISEFIANFESGKAAKKKAKIKPKGLEQFLDDDIIDP